MKTPYELIENKYNELITFFNKNRVRNNLLNDELTYKQKEVIKQVKKELRNGA